MHGDSLQTYVVAIVVVEPEKIKALLKEKGIDLDLNDLGQNPDNYSQQLNTPDIKKVVMDDMKRLEKEHDIKGFEAVKKAHLICDPFTVDNDILTPKMSIKRHVAKKLFES